MLSFFSTPYCAAAPAPRQRQRVSSINPTLGTLFSLLDDFETYHDLAALQESRLRQLQQQQQQRHAAVAFKPRFDVRESETAYILHGELPGIERDNLSLQFTDPQTLVVRGRISAPPTQPTQPTSASAAAAAAEPVAAASAAEHEHENENENDADETASIASGSSKSSGWHHATVEDDPEEPATPKSETVAAAPAPEPAPEPTAPEAAKAEPETEKQQQQQRERVWLHERSIGEFSRTFTFPARIEADEVSATLDNGVLSVTVPKARSYEPRRIYII